MDRIAKNGKERFGPTAARAAALLTGVLLLGACSTSEPAATAATAATATAAPGTAARVPQAVPYRSEISIAARRHAIPPAFLLAIIHAESNFDPHAVSHKGAVGLMQLMPATAKWMAPGVTRRQLFDPAVNIELGARYLRYLANRYGGDAERILIAWNAGPSRLESGRIPGETRTFVRRVRGLYARYARA